ncbi:hypothetical protein SAMN05444166_1977 [Singulisphaera sp. GP187]|uniref:hypothetical protein n=1 Tax=Singulisphaera sp. GP187 TaxID=1882752 RepID=UPI000929177D|nr:hypothetical protein [Singulisphaera sp. GP187]SIN99955.1 hypothetical protein SAMN05444166_1977 [Singulisphaera sp. GP187]
MWRVRGKFHWRVGALATGLLTATVWAQPPVPIPPTGPTPTGRGPLTRRELRHKAWRDTFIGRPADFVEPPLGTYVQDNFSLMRAKADPHRFTLYRSDFLDSTDRLSPTGAARFNLMASRLSGWLGPVVIEWSPDEPGLAESRRTAVVAALQGAGLPVIPERVVIGPSVYPGGLGEDAVNYHNVMITRDQRAPSTYSVSPASSSGFSVGGGGSQ